MGIVQLSPALLLQLHGVGAITLVWYLNHVALVPSNMMAKSRRYLANRLIDLGIRPIGPNSRAFIHLNVPERRQDPRTAGNDVPLFIHDESGFFQGRVVNRSRGGLCIAAEASVKVGQAIRIQSQLRANSCVLINMEVCHVRQEGDEWIFGCKFVGHEDLEVLKLFG
jgi:hypothetical protein